MPKDQESVMITMETVKILVNSIANIRQILDYTESKLLGIDPAKPAQPQTKAPSTPEPTSEAVPDAPQSIEGKISNIYVNTKNHKTGKAYKKTQYVFVIGEAKLTTFDSAHHELAKEAKAAGKAVYIEYMVRMLGTTAFWNITEMTVDPN